MSAAARQRAEGLISIDRPCLVKIQARGPHKMNAEQTQTPMPRARLPELGAPRPMPRTHQDGPQEARPEARERSPARIRQEMEEGDQPENGLPITESAVCRVPGSRKDKGVKGN